MRVEVEGSGFGSPQFPPGPGQTHRSSRRKVDAGEGGESPRVCLFFSFQGSLANFWRSRGWEREGNTLSIATHPFPIELCSFPTPKAQVLGQTGLE